MTQSTQFRFKSKLPQISINIFSKMSALAQQHQAVNLSQGFPDFDIDNQFTSLVTHNMSKGFNQYAPMPGVIELRNIIAQKYQHYYNLRIDAEEEITITAGGTEGIYSTIATLVTPGDEVIIFEPAYDSYSPSVLSFGGKVKPIVLEAPNFVIDWDIVEECITDKTKLIIINNPNNPTGRLLQKEDFYRLEEIVQRHGVYILSDEVYEHLVFDNHNHRSILSSPILRKVGFVIASFGKVLHATGWKLGYVISTPFLTAEFRKIHQFNVFSVNTPFQYAVAEYLTDTTYYKSLATLFQQKRDYVMSKLKDSPYKILPCEGTYFLLLDYHRISEEKELNFAEFLTKEKRVATIPVSAFYSQEKEQHLIRICFAKKQETLDKGITNLLQF